MTPALIPLPGPFPQAEIAMSNAPVSLAALGPAQKAEFKRLTSAPRLSWPTIAIWLMVMTVYIGSDVLAFMGLLPLWVAMLINCVIGYYAFTVVHDSIHRAISTNTRVNDWIGQSAVLLGAPYVDLRLFRWAHILHHRFTTGPKDPDIVLHGAWWTLPLRWLVIDVLYLMGVDLLRDCPSPALAAKALKKAFVVLHEVARTETAEHADVLLPVTASQERAGTRTDWEGRPQAFRHALEGPNLVQDDWEVLVTLSGLLGGDLGFNDLDGIRADRARIPARTAARAWPEVAAPEAADGDETAPEGLALVTSPLLLEPTAVLADADDLMATARDPWVALHPFDAADLGIADGDVVEVTGAGTVRLPARVTDDQAPGTAWVPSHAEGARATDLGDPVTAATITLSVAATEEVGA